MWGEFKGSAVAKKHTKINPFYKLYYKQEPSFNYTEIQIRNDYIGSRLSLIIAISFFHNVLSKRKKIRMGSKLEKSLLF